MKNNEIAYLSDFCPFSREWLLHIERVNKKRQGEFYRAIIDYLTGYEPEINSLDVKTFEILKPQLDRAKNDLLNLKTQDNEKGR